jgi:hypothetical protein
MGTNIAPITAKYISPKDNSPTRLFADRHLVSLRAVIMANIFAIGTTMIEQREIPRPIKGRCA